VIGWLLFCCDWSSKSSHNLLLCGYKQICLYTTSSIVLAGSYWYWQLIAFTSICGWTLPTNCGVCGCIQIVVGYIRTLRGVRYPFVNWLRRVSLFVWKLPLRLLRARSKRSGSRLRAFGSLRRNCFVYMRHNGGCQTTFYFDKSGAVYICAARYNEYVNLRMKIVLHFTHFSFILLPIPYN